MARDEFQRLVVFPVVVVVVVVVAVAVVVVVVVVVANVEVVPEQVFNISAFSFRNLSLK